MWLDTGSKVLKALEAYYDNGIALIEIQQIWYDTGTKLVPVWKKNIDLRVGDEPGIVETLVLGNTKFKLGEVKKGEPSDIVLVQGSVFTLPEPPGTERVNPEDTLGIYGSPFELPGFSRIQTEDTLRITGSPFSLPGTSRASPGDSLRVYGSQFRLPGVKKIELLDTLEISGSAFELPGTMHIYPEDELEISGSTFSLPSSLDVFPEDELEISGSRFSLPISPNQLSLSLLDTLRVHGSTFSLNPVTNPITWKTVPTVILSASITSAIRFLDLYASHADGDPLTYRVTKGLTGITTSISSAGTLKITRATTSYILDTIKVEASDGTNTKETSITIWNSSGGVLP